MVSLSTTINVLSLPIECVQANPAKPSPMANTNNSGGSLPSSKAVDPVAGEWISLGCSDAARLVLQKGGLNLVAARRVVEDLGYSEPTDLVHITEVYLHLIHVGVVECFPDNYSLAFRK